MVRVISREEMEHLLSNQAVLGSELIQNPTEIRVLLHLDNGDVCVVRYDLSVRKKEYWIDPKPPS